MRTIIIEDNEMERENLEILLVGIDEIKLVGTANTIQSGIELANRECPDLIFLDIQLGNENSLDHIHKLTFNPHIICCTLYDGYALQAFEVGVTDYLTKPITPEKLNRALKRLPNSDATHLDRTAEALPLDNGTTTQMVPFSQIIQITADHNYTTVRDEHRAEFLCTRRMQDWAELLPASLFAALDRSTIINRKQVASFSQLRSDRTAKITFRNQHTLEIGATALRRLKSIMG